MNSPNTGSAASSSAEAMFSVAAPSCASSTTTSASPLASSPSLSCAATASASATGSRNVMPAMPSGLTSDAGLLGDHADDADPDAADGLHGVRRQRPLVAPVDVRAEVREVGPRRSTRPVRSAMPLSNSWLPTAEASSPIRFSASIVGLSWSIAEMNVDAPMLSPADTNSVFGFSARSWLTSPRELGRAADRRRPARCRRLEPAVEVVDAQQLQVDRADGAGARVRSRSGCGRWPGTGPARRTPGGRRTRTRTTRAS